MGRADFYDHGNPNKICDGCGQKYKASELRETWDHKLMCSYDWEQRQPQDLLKAMPDNQSIDNPRPESNSTITYWGVTTEAVDNPIEINLNFATDDGVSESFDPLGAPTVGFPATGTYDGSEGNPAGSMTFYSESDGGDTYYYRQTLEQWGVPSGASVTNISLLTVDAKGETVGTAFNYLPQVTLRLQNLDYVSFKEPAGGSWNGNNDWEALTEEFGDTITYPIASDVELTISVKAFAGGGTTQSHQMWYDNIKFSITHTGGSAESSSITTGSITPSTDEFLTTNEVTTDDLGDGNNSICDVVPDDPGCP